MHSHPSHSATFKRTNAVVDAEQHLEGGLGVDQGIPCVRALVVVDGGIHSAYRIDRGFVMYSCLVASLRGDHEIPHRMSTGFITFLRDGGVNERTTRARHALPLWKHGTVKSDHFLKSPAARFCWWGPGGCLSP